MQNGSYVKHKMQNYKGIIIGTTSLKHLFEDTNDDKEYQVAVVGTGDIKIASPSNLICLNEEDVKECIVEAHKKFLADKGLPYKGFNPLPSSKSYRETHCYSCKSPINNIVDIECIECHWIICSKCGACGCGYSERGNKVS